MKKRKVIFRADGNSIIGFGHFFRILAVAEMIKCEFDVYAAVMGPDSFIKNQLKLTGIGLIELPYFDYAVLVHTGDEIGFDLDKIVYGDEIVVLDGYLFGNDYRKKLKSKGCFIVYIDDIYKNYDYADVIINHSISASVSQYKNTFAQIFVGPQYSLLRKEFLKAAQQQIKKYKFNTVFICFGGADSEELAYKISSLLLFNLTEINTIHVLNSSSYKGDIIKFYKQAEEKNVNISVHQNLTSNGIIELMNASDVGIVSASNIAYECACAKLPMIVGYYVDHQIDFYNALSEQSNVEGAGKWQDVTSEFLNRKIQKLIKEYNPGAASFIDGLQQKRFLDIFKSIGNSALAL